MTVTDPGPRGRRWLTVLAVASTPALLLGAAVASGLIQRVRDRAEPAPSPSCTNPAPAPAGEVGPPDRAPGGGGLRVVEKGFTQLSAGSDRVSLGAVLENTGTWIAYRTRIIFHVSDRQNRPATTSDGSEFFRVEIPVIFPGQRLITGNSAYVNKEPDTDLDIAVRVAGFDIEVGSTHWLPAESVKRTFAQVSTEGQHTEGDPGSPAYGDVTYTLRSGYCYEVPLRGVTIVFRNSAGAIVGGDFDHNTGGESCQPGSSQELAGAYQSAPKAIDPARTEVYPYCDVARPAPNPTTSDATIN
jgi:hypothetical protein